MGKTAAVVSLEGKSIEPTDPPVKRKRERIQLIETPPREDWFVTEKDANGRLVWFLRLTVTGMLVRRYGPFASRRKALLFLDAALGAMADALVSELEDLAQTRSLRRTYQYRQAFIEHPSLGQ